MVDLGGYNLEDYVWVWLISWWVGVCWDGGLNKGLVGSVEDVRCMVLLEFMIYVFFLKKRIYIFVFSRVM